MFSFSAQALEKKNQFEELFIWKTSEELKLTTQEEKKFTDIIKNLNKKKSDLSLALHESVDKMALVKTAKQRSDELAKYRKNLTNYNRIAEEEFDGLRVLLGGDRLVQYLKIKQDLTGRIKSLLANPEAPKLNEKKSLPAPKVIVE